MVEELFVLRVKFNFKTIVGSHCLFWPGTSIALLICRRLSLLLMMQWLQCWCWCCIVEYMVMNALKTHEPMTNLFRLCIPFTQRDCSSLMVCVFVHRKLPKHHGHTFLPKFMCKRQSICLMKLGSFEEIFFMKQTFSIRATGPGHVIILMQPNTSKLPHIMILMLSLIYM